MTSARIRYGVGAVVLSCLCLCVVAVGYHSYYAKTQTGTILSRRSRIPLLDPGHPCGPVSAAIVSHWLESPTELDECCRIIPYDGEGRTSVVELLNGLRAMGFATVAVKIDRRAARYITVPMILLVHGSHFAAALTIDARRVVVVDPPYEPTVRLLDELTAEWSGEVVLIAREQNDLARVLAVLQISDADRLPIE